MSVYGKGVDAVRETTKWLAASVPIASLVGAAAVAGPGLVRSVQATPSLGDWLGEHWVVVLCGLGLVGGIVAILWSGAAVLSAEPTDLDGLFFGETKADLAAAIGSGATLPYYIDKSILDKEFDDWVTALDSDSPPKADDPKLTRLVPAMEAIREWAMYREVQRPFKVFRVVFVVSVIAIVVAIFVAPTQLGSSAVIDQPTTVEVGVSDSGQVSLNDATGCTGTSTFTAVSGTWDRPVLAVDGPGCAFGATWTPHREDIELRLPATP